MKVDEALKASRFVQLPAHLPDALGWGHVKTLYQVSMYTWRQGNLPIEGTTAEWAEALQVTEKTIQTHFTLLGSHGVLAVRRPQPGYWLVFGLGMTVDEQRANAEQYKSNDVVASSAKKLSFPVVVSSPDSYTSSTHTAEREKQQQTAKKLSAAGEAARDALTAIGMARRDAERLAAHEDAAWIADCIAAGKAKAARGEIKRNLAGYVRTLIEQAEEVATPDDEQALLEQLDAARVAKSVAAPAGAELWQRVLEQLQLSLAGDTFRAWFTGSVGAFNGHGDQVLIVRLQNERAVAFVEGRLRKQVNRALACAAPGIEVEFVA